ncbi:hypothetical protein Ahy_A03g010259 isoform C [Arachis hypogaea]|uniref:Uncharacterized protein n=1 Tax=Arachis hypogaea TaxID=3818 RepID=A0A445DLR1_ARAHY|nr:hypothetical protein Ahy_A03g010259 isoform C [Arachis hypogaea]
MAFCRMVNSKAQSSVDRNYSVSAEKYLNQVYNLRIMPFIMRQLVYCTHFVNGIRMERNFLLGCEQPTASNA